MATSSKIPVTPGTGISLDTVQVTTDSGIVEREGVFIGDPTEGGRRAEVTTAGALKVDNGLSQPLTDTQLRATAVLVSTGLSQPVTDAQLRADDVPVTDEAVFNSLTKVLEQLSLPIWYDPTTNSLKAIVTGSVTATVASTTVTSIGGIASDPQVPSLLNQAWASCTRSLLT